MIVPLEHILVARDTGTPVSDNVCSPVHISAQQDGLAPLLDWEKSFVEIHLADDEQIDAASHNDRTDEELPFFWRGASLIFTFTMVFKNEPPPKATVLLFSSLIKNTVIEKNIQRSRFFRLFRILNIQRSRFFGIFHNILSFFGLGMLWPSGVDEKKGDLRLASNRFRVFGWLMRKKNNSNHLYFRKHDFLPDGEKEQESTVSLGEECFDTEHTMNDSQHCKPTSEQEKQPSASRACYSSFVVDQGTQKYCFSVELDSNLFNMAFPGSEVMWLTLKDLDGNYYRLALCLPDICIKRMIYLYADTPHVHMHQGSSKKHTKSEWVVKFSRNDAKPVEVRPDFHKDIASSVKVEFFKSDECSLEFDLNKLWQNSSAGSDKINLYLRFVDQLYDDRLATILPVTVYMSQD